jgi:APA family basic amino acid/polyamine antiporter
MIGTVIFTGTGFLAGQLGSPRLLLGIWVVGAITALLGALCYSELGINLPSSGGEYVYLTRAYGPTWGFVTGWASFFAGFSGPIALAALAFSGYVGHFFPSVNAENAPTIVGSGTWAIHLGGAQLLAASLVTVFTVLNVFGLQRAARVQNVLTSAKVVVLVAFIVLGFASGRGDIAHFSMNAVRDHPETPLAAQFGVSLIWVYLAYSGWNAATYVAEELRQPSRTLPLALGVGTALVAVLYFLLNVVFIYAAPLEDMKGQLAVGSFAASRLFGPQVAGLFAGLMAVSLMSTVNAMVTTGPRVYYAMAGNGAFLAAAAKVHPRFHTPVAAIVAQGICTILMTLTPFTELVTYIGFTLNIFTVLSVVALMKFRRKQGWRKLSAVNFCYPLIPVLYILAGAWLTLQGSLQRPYISLATLLTMVTGAAVYHFKLRPGPPAAPPGIETY